MAVRASRRKARIFKEMMTESNISHLQTYSTAVKLMGNQFELTAVHESLEVCKHAVETGILEIKRIEALLTTFSEDSITATINKNAGIQAVQVPDEVFYLIERCERISILTQGAFDITYGSVDKKYWNFNTKMSQLPDSKLAKNAVKLVDYRNLIHDVKEKTVFLKHKGMRIGFGGVGKGYAADMAKKVMKIMGIDHGVVNASGDLTAWGHQADGKPWTIGIADPNQKHDLISTIDLTDTAVATSGNYEKYAIINGRKYSHTIDPKTGYPVSGIKSVSIITKNAELADALATPVTVMGIKAGLYLINQLNGVETIIVDDFDRIYTSKNIKINRS